MIAAQKVKVFKDVHEAQTWYGARDKCAEFGLHLLSINSEEKNDEVVEFLREVNET